MNPRNALMAVVLAALTTGCATSGPVAGMDTTKYTTFTCVGGKSFGARMEEDHKSVRLRTHEGSVNVAASTEGTFAGEGWTFTTVGADGVSLKHKDKMVGKNCRKEA